MFSEENEVLFKKYDGELGAFYYQITLGLLSGDLKALSDPYEINSKNKVVMKRIDTLKIPSLSNQSLLEIMRFLAQQSGKVTNVFLFLKDLNGQVNQLITKAGDLFELKDEDIKEFNDKINIFICKQKCPCCDRICGVEEPTHNYHQCIYGHQIRGIGGVMLENQDASVARCEDIEDIDKMQYNGQEMTWMEFKQKMKEQTNNPWIFDDVMYTRGNLSIKERFKLAWTLIGKRICQERYKDSKMKYVEYNQAIIDNQKVKQALPKNYIYMIDSSGSMHGDRWKDLLNSLKKTLGQICAINTNSKVTILNFSSSVKDEYVSAAASSINVEALTFQGQGTNFEAAFIRGFEHIKKITSNDIVLVFMTDGEDSYPQNAVNNLKFYLKTPNFQNLKVKFDFNAIGFQCNTSILNTLVQELGGTTHFADNGAQLTRAFMEILNKKTD